MKYIQPTEKPGAFPRAKKATKRRLYTTNILYLLFFIYFNRKYSSGQDVLL